MSKWASLLVVVGACLLAAAEAAAGTIYTTESNGGRLGTISTSTGAGTDIGSFATGATWGNAFDLDGSMYASLGMYSIARINLATGATISSAGLSVGLYGIEIAANGTLYGAGFDGRLYTINKSTGAMSNVGYMGGGMGTVMDLAFDSAGVLWATDGSNNLWTLNLASGAATFQKTMTGLFGSVMGITFDESNVLFATDYTSNSHLYSINTTTGAATYVGLTGFNGAHGGDIAFSVVPLPPAALMGLVLLGGLGILTQMKRRRQATLA